MPKPSTFRNTVVDIPTMIPIQDARNTHFMILMKRTELSMNFLFMEKGWDISTRNGIPFYGTKLPSWRQDWRRRKEASGAGIITDLSIARSVVHDEIVSSVLLPASLGAVGADGLFFSVADQRDAAAGNAHIG